VHSKRCDGDLLLRLRMYVAFLRLLVFVKKTQLGSRMPFLCQVK